MSLKSSATLSLLVGLLIAPTGCNSAAFAPSKLANIPEFPRQDLSESARPSIKKIAVVQVPSPGGYGVIDEGALGPLLADSDDGLLVLIGNISEAMDPDQNSKDFTQAMKKQGIAVSDRLNKTIELWLKQQGYEVNLVSSEDARASAMAVGADAILFVQIEEAGYFSPRLSNDYVPFLEVEARLRSMKDGSTLYLQTIIYSGHDGRHANIDYLTAPTEHKYINFETLMANSKAAQERLEIAAGPIARHIALQLGKAPAAVTPPPSAAPAVVAPPPPSAAPAVVTP